MSYFVEAKDLEAIAKGGALLGTGGGGDPYIGMLMAQASIEATKPVEVVDVETIADDALCIPVCMMGAPTVMLEKLPAGGEALEALRLLEQFLGQKVDYLICIEAGGLNSTIPFSVAAETGLPLLDGDGMGRAFPELQMVSFTMGGVTASPMVLADDKGNSSVLNVISNQWAERLARVQTIEMGGSSLVALYPMTGKQAKDYLLRGTLSLIQKLGTIIDEERAENRNPMHRLNEELDGISLGSGRVYDIERATTGGFARGKALLSGIDDYAGKSFALEFQNEFLMLRNGEGEVLATTPDLICALDADSGNPVTTEQLRFGLAINLIGLKADPIWRSEAGIELAGPRYFKYDTDYTPIEELNNGGQIK